MPAGSLSNADEAGPLSPENAQLSSVPAIILRHDVQLHKDASKQPAPFLAHSDCYSTPTFKKETLHDNLTHVTVVPAGSTFLMVHLALSVLRHAGMFDDLAV